VQVYLHVPDDAGAVVHVLLFCSPPGPAPAPQLGRDKAAAACDDDALSAASCSPSAAAARVTGGDAGDAVQCAATHALRQLAGGADAAAGVAALRRSFGAGSCVVHAAAPVHGALSAYAGSRVRLAFRGSSLLLWQPAEERPLAALARALASLRSARFVALLLAAALGMAYHASCSPARADARACAAAKGLLPPVAGLLLALSVFNSPLARGARAALTRTHAD
jgi:hypothetical protein